MFLNDTSKEVRGAFKNHLDAITNGYKLCLDYNLVYSLRELSVQK